MDQITYRNPEQAFNDAIKAGLLNECPGTKDYAGDYMYMHTEDGIATLRDAFKHVITRKYIRNITLK